MNKELNSEQIPPTIPVWPIFVFALIATLILVSSLDSVDLAHNEAKEVLLSMSSKSDVHNALISQYLDCRQADMNRESCLMQATYITEASYDKGITSMALTDVRHALIAGDKHIREYDVFYAGITFRAWRAGD
jgi:hypothetical protein